MRLIFKAFKAQSVQFASFGVLIKLEMQFRLSAGHKMSIYFQTVSNKAHIDCADNK